MAEGQAAVKAFNRIIKWLKAHKKGKATLPSLNKPATAKAIAEFEAKTKLKLPPGFAAVYRLHDGQSEDAANEALDEASGVDSVESGLFPSLEKHDLAFLLVPLKELARNTARLAHARLHARLGAVRRQLRRGQHRARSRVEGREKARAACFSSTTSWGAPSSSRRRSRNTSSRSRTGWSRSGSSGMTTPACRTRRGGIGTI